MTGDDVHERLDRLESIVERQQETIDRQRETIAEQRDRMDELVADTVAASHPHLVADGGAIKVVGDIAADEGIGVRGHASATGINETTGVEGIADADADNSSSPEVIPAGVHGETTGQGATHAVRGDASSENGRGVAGFATSSGYEHNSLVSVASGVMGVTDRTSDGSLVDAAGVVGISTAGSGSAYGVVGRTESPDGAALWGIATGGATYSVVSHGDTYIAGDHDITGKLTFPDETPQRTAGPVAKGFINSDGTIQNAVNVDEATWDSDVNRYEITLNGIDYSRDGYVTVIVPMSTSFPDALPSTTSGGDLQVNFDDKSRHDFAFVSYELPDGEATTSGVDATESHQFPDGAGFGGQ